MRPATLLCCASLVGALLFELPSGLQQQQQLLLVIYVHNIDKLHVGEFAFTTVSDGTSLRELAYALPITANVSSDSLRLGSVRGLSLVSISTDSDEPLKREQLFNTVDYDDGVYKGTICQHGQINYPDRNGSELAVVGGTGDFRRVQGYSVATVASEDPLVLRYDVHLFFPTSIQSPTCKPPLVSAF